jgi:type II secretory pathway component PulF
MAFVLPRFATIYAQRSASLPLPAKILMAVSEFVTGQYMIYVPVLAVAVTALVLWIRHPSGRRALDWMRLNLPILRTLFGQLYLTRAARTMSTLLASGVSLLDVIDICRGVTNNSYWNDLWNGLESGIRDGKRIAESIAATDVMPPNVSSMIAAGERSGQLGEVMGRVAEFSEEELDNAVKQTTAFIEPLMICIMGVVIGGVAMALLLPIFTVGNVMAGH